MGAEYFEHYVNESDIDVAFEKAVSEAQYDHGHSGYTGTIAEKSSYQVLTKEVFTPAEASDYADKQYDNPVVDSKWGPAAAIRVASDKADGWLFFGWASS